MGHYPSEQVLQIIKEYDITNKPIKDLVELVHGEWEWEDYLTIKKYRKTMRVQFHTGGWSGNEDTYYAFEKVKFIGLFWLKSERGGHYYYEFPLWAWEYGLKKDVQKTV